MQEYSLKLTPAITFTPLLIKPHMIMPGSPRHTASYRRQQQLMCGKPRSTSVGGILDVREKASGEDKVGDITHLSTKE